MTQALQNNVQMQTAQASKQVQDSSTQLPGGVETATDAFKEDMSKTPEERLQDKIKLTQAEKENSSSENGSNQVVDKFLASL